MRKVYKNRNNEEAVSPVIATILMVAITVVLAAVLYVMVIGMGGGTSKTAPAGAVTFDAINRASEKVTFGTFSPVPKPMDVKFIFTAGAVAKELTFASAPSGPSTNMTAAAGGPWGTYTDNNWAGNAINSGDYLTLTGLTPGTSYTMTIFHYTSDSLCSLVGTTTFTTAQ